MDKRKNYILVVDVETAGGFDNPLVYDIGFAICDKHGTVYEKYSFLISEIFDNKRLMNTAYYKEKVPKYIKSLMSGEIEKIDFRSMRKKFLSLISEYNVKTISAYNLKFDMGALTNTTKYLGIGKKFLDINCIGINLLCIWSFACEVLYTQKTYKQVAKRNGWVSEVGNIRTNAECGFNYINNTSDFAEEHTGLADVFIEIQILAKCFRQHKKHKSGIIGNCWRIPNRA